MIQKLNNVVVAFLVAVSVTCVKARIAVEPKIIYEKANAGDIKELSIATHQIPRSSDGKDDEVGLDVFQASLQTEDHSETGSKGGEAEKTILPKDLEEVKESQYASLSGLASGSSEAQQNQRQAVESLGLPLEVKTRKTGISFRLIPAGTFTMGNPMSELDNMVAAGIDRRYGEREKEHRVILTQPFYCGTHEVTQGQWQQVMGKNPSHFTSAGQDAPVEQVNWNDCQWFLQKLCQLEGVPNGTFRLLTEAEWEYACRAGTEKLLYNGDLVIKGLYNSPALDPIAWYGGNSGVNYQGAYDSSYWKEKQYRHFQAGTHPVGEKKCNAFGLHDMIGNVWEWCQDWYQDRDDGYPSGSFTDPSGPRSGIGCVHRGGSWISYARSCRSAYRWRFTPDFRNHDLGLRLMLNLSSTVKSSTDQSGSFNAPGTIPIKVVDSDGNPVVGAKIVAIGYLSTNRQYLPLRSDKQGRAVFISNQRPKEFYALHEATGMVGLVEVNARGLIPSITMTLEPSCHVFGRIKAALPYDTDAQMVEATAFISHYPKANTRSIIHFTSKRGNFEFLLPAGHYELLAHGLTNRYLHGLPPHDPLSDQESDHIRQPFTIDTNQRYLDMGVVTVPFYGLATKDTHVEKGRADQ
jgi:formylglycine-generating enzyme required for sulfatase activity